MVSNSQSYTLNGWLAKRLISRAQWYRMPPADRPDVYGTGRMQRISSDADARWIEREERKAKQQTKAA